jgi:hypothetical protein
MPRPLDHPEKAGTNWIGGWVDLTAGLGLSEQKKKSLIPLPEFKPRTIQPVP